MHGWLLAAHIAVLGYWLGSELVINSQYRFVTHRSDLPFAARDSVMDHLMDADQHVRYALILQLALGLMLASSGGLLGPGWLWAGLIGGVLWLLLVEAVHRLRKSKAGQTMAAADRLLRYSTMAALAGGTVLVPDWPLWLRVKLLLFVGVMACGVGIRFVLIRHFRLWPQLAGQHDVGHVENAIRRTYRQATAILVLLWVFIGAITVVAIIKP